MKRIDKHAVLSFIIGGCISTFMYLTGIIDERERQDEESEEA